MSHPSPYDRYEVVIGLEVHCQLLTQTKIFSAAPTRFGAAPNSQVMHVDLGLPGALPVLNRRAVELAVIAGLATSCRINPVSQFARKNYFYPDLPKGYQISQHTLPLCSEGWLDVPLEGGEIRRVRIERIHMEEDAGKSSHLASSPHSVIDLNRAGVPLIEVVSCPDMRSADEAVAYLKALHQLVVYLGVCDGNMEEGSFRCDANVSVRLHGEEALGTRCELKNINSFKFVRDAILFETRRQIDRIEAGHAITQQTRLYNPERGETLPMRDKEEAHDYRYFPEPDLPPLVLDDAWLIAQREALPELPAQRRERYQRDLNLSPYDAQVLTAQRPLSEYFEAALTHFGANPKLLTNWICNELLAVMGSNDTFEPPIAAEHMAALVALIDKDIISGKIAKQVFGEMLKSGRSPAQIVEEKGLQQITDPAALTPLIEAALRANSLQVQEYREGKTSLLAFFVGQVMKASRGKANPALVNAQLLELLESVQSE